MKLRVATDRVIAAERQTWKVEGKKKKVCAVKLVKRPEDREDATITFWIDFYP